MTKTFKFPFDLQVRGSNAMLTAIHSGGVAPEVNLRVTQMSSTQAKDPV